MPTPFCGVCALLLVGAQIFPYAPGVLLKVLLGASMHMATHIWGTVNSLLTHIPDNPYSTITHRKFCPPSWFTGKLGS